MSETFCGIDVGTQGVRAVLVDADGHLRSTGRAPLSPGVRTGERHEQDPEGWWAALGAAVRDAMREAGDVSVDGVSLDATSGTILVEAADGAPRGPALMYDDARAASEATVAQTAGRALWDELGYRIGPTWALPRMMWLARHRPLAPGERIVHQTDHLLRRLVGAPVPSDTSTALKSGADPRDCAWPSELLGELGVDSGVLPGLVLPGTPIGHVGADGAEATGLAAGTPVHAGTTDGCAAQIAAGAVRHGSWSTALGTTLVVKGSSAGLVRDPSGAVYCHRHPDGGWLPGGASSSGAGVLAKTLPGRDPAALTGRAAALVPVPGVTYPLAGRGERFPFVAPEAHGFVDRWVDGQADPDAARFAALCQAVAYVERLSYDVLAVLGADTSGPVATTGGGARNDWWNQLRADVLGRTVTRPASGEAALGAAILAAAAPGDLTTTTDRMVRIEGTWTFDPERHDAYGAGYVRLVRDLADRGWLDGSVAESVLADGVAA